MRRLAPPSRFSLGPALALALALPGCGKAAPNPTKLDDKTTLVSPPRAPQKDPASPFRHPDTEPPPARADPQVDAEALAAIWTAAGAARAAEDRDGAIRELRKCANKVPASPRCEALLGILMSVYPNRRAEYRYFLTEAANLDDPEMDDALLRELGESLMKQAMFAEAVTVYQRRLDRGAQAAADLLLLANALQGIAGREDEAANALAAAFALDPTHLEWLHDEAVLRGQLVGQARRAAALFKEYLARAHGADPEIEAKVEVRIRELEAAADARNEPPLTKSPDKGKTG